MQNCKETTWVSWKGSQINFASGLLTDPQMATTTVPSSQHYSQGRALSHSTISWWWWGFLGEFFISAICLTCLVLLHPYFLKFYSGLIFLLGCMRNACLREKTTRKPTNVKLYSFSQDVRSCTYLLALVCKFITSLWYCFSKTIWKVRKAAVSTEAEIK